MPLSQERDPIRKAQRWRTVENRLRAHRNRRAGRAPICDTCGGVDALQAEGDDVCRCGSAETNWEARVWRAAGNARRTA